MAKTNRPKQYGTCAHCLRENQHLRTRGLDARCYQDLIANDREMLESCYPRTYGRAEDRLEDYEFLLATEGATIAQAAERMGIHPFTLTDAIKRAKAKQK